MKPSTRNHFSKLVSTSLLVAVLLQLATGCRSTKVSSQYNASVGQQLLDLQKAHEQGVISDKEYERLKRKIVSKND